MTEIFDLLRDRVYLNNDKAKNFSKDTYVVNKAYVDQIINEAEAKWEADCCEWKDMRVADTYKTSCGEVDVYFGNYKICPYCGKRIKIVEVE